MVSAQMTSKGQLTVPAKIRNELHLESGSRVEFVKTSDGSYLIRPIDGSVQSLKGVVRAPAQAAVTLDDMDTAIASATSDSIRADVTDTPMSGPTPS